MKAFKKNELVLVPMAHISGITPKTDAKEKDNDSVVQVSSNGIKLMLSAPSRPTSMEKTDWKKDAMMVPYYWVSVVRLEDIGNMHITQKKTSDGTLVPCYCNSKALKEHDVLAIFKQDRGVKRKA